MERNASYGPPVSGIVHGDSILVRLPCWMPLPHWVMNPFYGPVITTGDLEIYSEAEDPSDTEPVSKQNV